MYRIDN